MFIPVKFKTSNIANQLIDYGKKSALMREIALVGTSGRRGWKGGCEQHLRIVGQ